jgi:iron complex outermembrane receptor protein
MTTHASAQSAKGVEEVIVTAQRRAEKLEDVPASVAVVSGETLAKAGTIRFTDFGQNITGVQIGITAGFTQPSIRGISTTIAGTGAENNVGTYVDGFYQNSPLSIDQDLANIESVEVLKGPQGSLYGRNATGGAILIRTKDPDNTATGQINASYGRFNDYQISGYFSLPVVEDRLAVSVAANQHENDGYIKDINCFANPAVRASVSPTRRTGTYGCNTAPYVSQSARLKAKWTPTDNLSFVLGYNYAHSLDPRGYAYQLNDHPGTTVKAILAGTFPAAAGYQQAYQMRDRTSLSFQPYNPDWTYEITLFGKLTTGDFGTLTTHTAFFREKNIGDLDIDATPVDATALYGPTKHHTFTQAVDYEFHGVQRLNLLAGMFYLRDIVSSNLSQTNALLTATPANPNGLLSATSQYLNTPNSWSGYIDGTYEVMDRLFLTAGVRYTRETKAADFATRNAAGVFVSNRGAGQPPESTFKATTPRAIVRYNIDDGTNVYASFSQGFKSGTYNNAPGLIVPVAPERVDAYEIGGKMRRGNFRVEAAAFYYDYRDLQISKTVLNPITLGFQAAISNAANSRVYGGELNVAASVTNELTVSAGIAYLHARYLDFRTATGTDTRIDTQTEQNSLPTNPQNWTGTPLVRSPSVSGNFKVDYQTPLADGTLNLSGHLYGTTSYTPKDGSIIRYVNAAGATVQDTGQRRYVQPGYVTLSFNAKWTDPKDHYWIGGYLRNVTDTRYRITYTSTSAGDYATFSEPRTYGVQVGVKF